MKPVVLTVLFQQIFLFFIKIQSFLESNQMVVSMAKSIPLWIIHAAVAIEPMSQSRKMIRPGLHDGVLRLKQSTIPA